MVRDKTRPEVYAPQSLAMSSDGIQHSSQFAGVRLAWSFVDDVAELPSHTIITVQGAPTLIIPKRSIIEGDHDRFVSDLRGRVSQPTANHR